MNLEKSRKPTFAEDSAYVLGLDKNASFEDSALYFFLFGGEIDPRVSERKKNGKYCSSFIEFNVWMI